MGILRWLVCLGKGAGELFVSIADVGKSRRDGDDRGLVFLREADCSTIVPFPERSFFSFHVMGSWDFRTGVDRYRSS
jgi:hypothetical protein